MTSQHINSTSLDERALDQIFRNARSVHSFTDEPIPDETIHSLYDLLKWGPTALNSQPARFLFVRSLEAKQRLVPHMMNSNQEKTLKAPLTVIVAIDVKFYDQLDAQWPVPNVKKMYVDSAPLAESTAMRNSSLQGAYLLLAARAMGLSVGPMSGFNSNAVDKEFFPDGMWRSNFIVNVGYYNNKPLHPRGPRLEFATAAKIV